MSDEEIDVLLLLNTKSAEARMTLDGYAPNPRCPHCRGFGKVHPQDAYGKVVWEQAVSCQQPGCLADSFRKHQMGKA